jgi:hypothetical protein
MNIGYVGGFWSTNIGNSFYNIGMLWLLRNIYGEKSVHFVPDPPQVNWSRLNGDYGLIARLEIDLFIISGPILGYGIEKIYSKIFDEITAKGKQIGFVSAGSVRYTEDEAKFVASFLRKYNVKFVFTRDSETYRLYKDKLNAFIYDGLCTSMFLNDAITPPDINEDYVVTNFPYWHEPLLARVGERWLIGRNRGIVLRQQNEVDGLPIVRLQSAGSVPNFRFLRTSKLLYTRGNMYYSDLPYGYLSILKSAKFVFSDRVHSCAAGLILGTKCMYIKGQRRSRDNRNSIFLRLGLPDIYDQPVSLDMSYIEFEKNRMRDAIVSAIGLSLQTV